MSLDEIFDAMAAVQRRKLLLALLEHDPQDDPPVDVADAVEGADAVHGLVAMHHVHLPKLEQYGFVDWDPDTHEVTVGPNFDQIRPLLEVLADDEDDLPDR